MMVGLIKADDGEILIDAQDITHHPYACKSPTRCWLFASRAVSFPQVERSG